VGGHEAGAQPCAASAVGTAATGFGGEAVAEEAVAGPCTEAAKKPLYCIISSGDLFFLCLFFGFSFFVFFREPTGIVLDTGMEN
jgi:hypothetical protein